MTPDPNIDGAIGQGWGGVAPDGVHVNVVLGRRGSPTAAALLTAFASPSPGHTPVLVCVGPDQPSYEAVVPPTVMMNKATATEDRHQTLTWGAAQAGVAAGVLNAVRKSIVDGNAVDDLVLIAAVWVNPHAGKAGYAPVQGGIVAALPYLDDLLAGHSLATLAKLLKVVRDA